MNWNIWERRNGGMGCPCPAPKQFAVVGGRLTFPYTVVMLVFAPGKFSLTLQWKSGPVLFLVTRTLFCHCRTPASARTAPVGQSRRMPSVDWMPVAVAAGCAAPMTFDFICIMSSGGDVQARLYKAVKRPTRRRGFLQRLGYRLGIWAARRGRGRGRGRRRRRAARARSVIQKGGEREREIR